MDQIELLHKRKSELLEAGKSVRADIRALCDEDSFVELSAFSYSKDAFYGEEAQGEGVVTGFATIGGYPYYIVAQNFAVSYGGFSKANCEKIASALAAAEKNDMPVVYLLHSQGVRVGEGTDVLEGVSDLLMRATRLKGSVLQFAILVGGAYGPAAALASLCDCVIFGKEGSLCLGSPLVLSAREGKNLTPAEVGGYDALGGAVLPAVKAADMKEAASVILRVTDLVRIPVTDAELNDSSPALNRKADAKEVLGILEGGLELGGNSCPEVRTVLARVGGIAIAAAVFDGAAVHAEVLKKLRSFAEFASCFGLPFVTFVDCVGVEPTLKANNSVLYREMGEYLSVFDSVDAKIAVVTGKAIGLGYSLFAAKSAGFDYTYALATAQISLFESGVGAQIEYSDDPRADKDALALRYAAENGDPVNAAKGGYLDNIIEPQFLKQYLVASLQTLIR